MSGAGDDAISWKRGERKRLRQMREALPAGFRLQADAGVAALLERELPQLASQSFSFYWPMVGEPDLRDAAARWAGQGAQASLPETVPRSPLIYRPWSPGCAMRAGVWNIPVPDTAVEAMPRILLIPCLGFDQAGFRLGNGGGYYDRTLAALSPRPLAVGIAYSHAILPSIHPEPHDIPMDLIVTEQAAVWHAPKNASDR